jgi:hypothetical protein
MKKALLVLWNITLLSCITILAGSCSPSLTSQVRAMERAHNLHQLDKELSFYADDARFETDDWTVQGKDGLRKLFTVDVLLNGSLAFSDISIVGNTVVCKVEEKNDMFRALGVEAVRHERTEIVFKNGLIQKVKGTESAQSESEAELYKADEAFSAWADKNRLEEVAKLLGGKPFEGFLTPENALGFLKLAREWKKLKRIQ